MKDKIFEMLFENDQCYILDDTKLRELSRGIDTIYIGLSRNGNESDLKLLIYLKKLYFLLYRFKYETLCKEYIEKHGLDNYKELIITAIVNGYFCLLSQVKELPGGNGYTFKVVKRE